MSLKQKPTHFLCAENPIRMADLLAPGKVSVPTQWQLFPPPTPATIRSLESDEDPDWISWRTPYSAISYRGDQPYIQFAIPVKRLSLNTIDQWVTPDWLDKASPDGPVRTNEMVHFVLDNCMPVLNDLMGSSHGRLLYDLVVAAGRAQREARRTGRSDEIWGEGLDESSMFPYIISTMAIATEIKNLLPDEGVKRMFMMVTAKSLKDSRMDLDITMLDEGGELMALGHQLVQVVPIEFKKVKRSVL